MSPNSGMTGALMKRGGLDQEMDVHAAKRI